ncbi:Glycogen synthase, ADP-glucose transglucosylase [Methylophaga frappieri]|uniref:Glycogen synthase n=1 Tax=Methylophaga frappieri (strain ATCC BAA-2434 / DSM 25690 / JAM7) TaxID=754477 RepID=I1YHK6_METFJ|nr:glycogen synthase GlgA [Methylophaga frappieri]AFJ02399.1 Glycogen synthase, ADP-glucose transglucosylase [Methylophaga frappieri]
MRKILFASSEVAPLVKTGGLADVSASLPAALAENHQDVRIIMPAYRSAVSQLKKAETVAEINVNGYGEPVRILQATLPGTSVCFWLVDAPDFFDRDGGPYGNRDGDWPDNPARFTLFCRVVVAIALNQAGLHWQPDIVHCHDWQTGLIPALLSLQSQRPKTVFTIHNLAYQGIFDRQVFDRLDLPDVLWRMEGLEYWGQWSFMKGGLAYADQLTTVSPTYAQEICTPEFGYGLAGLLAWRYEQGELTGIVNGIDTEQWNPATDSAINQPYSAAKIRLKAANKSALQQDCGLPVSPKTLLIGLISRLVEQKGIDHSIAAIRTLLEEQADIQLVCLGAGQPELEFALQELRAHYPDKVALQIGYNEALAHQIEAGADAFLMPSRFEPCGLNQLYSLRYGTLPIVRKTGGLADTVIDASDENRKNHTATGFVFAGTTVSDLTATLRRVMDLYDHPRLWRRVMLTAMLQDVSWASSAAQYVNLYQKIN